MAAPPKMAEPNEQIQRLPLATKMAAPPKMTELNEVDSTTEDG